MAVEIETEGALELDTPRALFERLFDDYDVGPLGERFIMVDTSVARAAPRELILVQNWSLNKRIDERCALVGNLRVFVSMRSAPARTSVRLNPL